jgi:chloramphenicol 3-O-phosphotransferase
MSHQTVSEPWFDPQTSCAVILITGIQAAGKSTVAQLLAERLPRSVHVRGDVFRRMVINGRAEMTPGSTDEAVRQLQLRHQLTAMVTDAYFHAGFTVVTQDIILGDHLAEMITMIKSRPLFLIVLAPPAVTVAGRERARGKTAYDTWAIEQLDQVLRHETPRLGLWLDTSGQTAAESADEILAHAWSEASIQTPPQEPTRTQPPAD